MSILRVSIYRNENNFMHFCIDIKNIKCKDNAKYAENISLKQGSRKKHNRVWPIASRRRTCIELTKPQYTDNG